MRRVLFGFLAFGLVLVAAATVQAQPGGGRGGFGGFGGFGGRGSDLMGLLRVEEVQKELDLIEAQMEDINKLQEEMRGERGQGRGNQNFREMSEEERQKAFEEMRKQAEERTKKTNEKLKEILFPEQFTRLEEISIQQRGVSALMDPAIAAKLKITPEQTKKMEEVQQAAGEEMRSQMQELFGGGRGRGQGQGQGQGNRDEIRQKLDDMRKKSEEKILAVLSADQKKSFEDMKGKPFEMPERTFGGRGGRGQGAPGGRGGRGGNGN